MAGLHLERGHWYAWQMLPGYSGVIPYFSPIRVDSVTPKKAGDRRFRLSFLNAMYATGVQPVEMELHILKHDERYLIAEIDDETEDDRSVVISPITFEWIEMFVSSLRLPPPGEWQETNLSGFLDRTLAGNG